MGSILYAILCILIAGLLAVPAFMFFGLFIKFILKLLGDDKK